MGINPRKASQEPWRWRQAEPPWSSSGPQPARRQMENLMPGLLARALVAWIWFRISKSPFRRLKASQHTR